MRMAFILADEGTCDRKKVGAIIVRDGRCISWGYNGAPPGMPHCDENNHGWGKVKAPAGLATEGCINATHAEANALAFAARQGISTDDATLFVSVSPCLDCARLLIAAGISTVIYSQAYRLPAGRELLEKAGVTCRMVTRPS